MTTRHVGYVVTLENETREDDAEATLNAIMQIKGVVGVNPIIKDHATLLAEVKAWNKMRDVIVNALNDSKP